MKNLTFLFILISTTFCRAQMSGSYSVPGSFNSLAQAINDLNTYGVSGPATINIAANYTETVVAGGYTLYSVAGTSSVNTITFQKNGMGNNPKIYGYTGSYNSNSSVQDGIWRFIGADYIIVDGIDLVDQRTTSPGTMEFGFGFYNANLYDGCQYNTIRNCGVSLNHTVITTPGSYAFNGSRGIEMMDVRPTGMNNPLNITLPSASHNYNRFYSNIIQNCSYGIVLKSEVPYVGNDIGGLVAATGNTIVNYGGSTVYDVCAIYTKGQTSLNISNNYINNNNGSGAFHRSLISGILNEQTYPSDVSIQNNTVTIRTTSLSSSSTCIRNTGSAKSFSINLNGNLIANCSTTLSSGLSRFKGITNEADAAYLSMSANVFTNNLLGSITQQSYLLLNQGAVNGSMHFDNNILSERSPANSGASYIFGIRNESGSPTSIVSFSNNLFTDYDLGGSPMIEYLTFSGESYSTSFSGNSWLANRSAGSYSVILIKNAGTIHSNLLVNNNTVNNYTCTANTRGWFGYLGTAAAPSQCIMTYSGNIFSNVATTTNGMAADVVAIYAADGNGSAFPHKLIYQNNISNFKFDNADNFYGIYSGRLGKNSQSQPSAIYQNTVSAVNCTCNISGIYTYSTTTDATTQIHNNTIGNLTAHDNFSYARGIYVWRSQGNMAIHHNLVHSVTANGTLRAAGIEWDGAYGRPIINNNIIQNISNPNTSLFRWSTSGIYIQSVFADADLSYNTIHLTGNAAEAAGVYFYGYGSLRLQNSLIINQMSVSPTFSAVAVVTNNTIDYSIFSNHNLFYMGTPALNRSLLLLGANSYSSMAMIQNTLGVQDLNSFSENTVFNSLSPNTPGYMSVSSNSVSSVESGATPISTITTDFYGNVRNAAHPDIGAVEGNYLAPPTDQSAPNIVNAGFVDNSCNLSGRTFTLELGDQSGIASGSLSPVAYYSINQGSYTPVQGTLSSGSSTLGLWSFALNYSASPGNTINYYLAAQDQAPTPNLRIYPPGAAVAANVNSIVTVNAPGTYTVRLNLSGTYTVGSAGTFSSLTSAANAYNQACLSGPVTFVLTNTLYTNYNQIGNETMPITFQKNPDASITNSLLIIPASGVSATISCDSDPNTPSYRAGIRFLDATHITVDGLNTNGSSLKIKNDVYPSSFFANIWLSNNDQGAGNSHISIRNLNIENGYFSTPGIVGYGILASGSNSFSPDNGRDNDFISITGNTFSGSNGYISPFSSASGAITSIGDASVTAGGNDHWQINNNLFHNPSGTANNKIGSGIGLKYTSLSSISNNTITDGAGGGIGLGQGCSVVEIDHNTISNLENSEIYGISVDTYCDNAEIVVKNNLISDLRTTAYLPFNFGAVGISVRGTNGVKIYNNSVSITQTTTVGQAISSACMLINYVDFGLDMRNNIFYNNARYYYSPSTCWMYGVYQTSSNTAFNHCDYNNYYVPAWAGIKAYNGMNMNTLNSIQQNMGGNLNSVSVLPAFISTVDAHLDPNSLNNYYLTGTGLPLADVTDDVDYEARNATTPVMGADEFTLTAPCISANSGYLNLNPTNVCETQSLAISPSSVSIGVGIIYQWEIASNVAGPFSNIGAGTGINTATYNTAAQLAPGSYFLRLSVSCPSASLTGYSNVSPLDIIATPTVNIASSSSVACGPQSITLTANGASSYTWNTGITGSVIVVSPSLSTNYYVIYANNPCPAAQSAIFPLMYAPNGTPVSIAASNSLLCGNSQVTLTANGATNYTWSSGATGSVIVVTPTATSIFSVSGANLNPICGSSAATTISVSSSPTLGINGPTLVCSPQTITLSATGASSYSWSTGSTSFSIAVTPTNTTVYLLSGTNAAGCSSTLTHTVQTGASISLGVSPPSTICAAQSVTLSVPGSLSYTWSTGAISPSVIVSPVTSTFYTVSAVVGGCILTETTSITISIPTASISGPVNLCLGQSATLTANGASNYTWSTGQSGSVITASPSSLSVYTLTATNNFGCNGTASFTVNVLTQPNLSISGNTLLCSGTSASLSVSGANSYTWSDGSTGNTLIVSPVTTTVYSVTGAIGTCSATISQAVNVLNVPVVSVTGNSVLCFPATTTTLNASGATSYTWTGGITSPSLALSQNATTIYTVQGLGSNNCIGQNTYTVYNYPASNPIVNPTNTTICMNGSATLLATSAQSYSWSTGGTGSVEIVSPIVTTIYTLTGISASGCVGTSTAIVNVLSNPTLSVSPSVTLCALSPVSFTVSGAQNYAWAGGATGTSATYTPATNATYTVMGTDANGCTSTSSISVTTLTLPTLFVTAANTLVCPGNSITLSATGAQSYTWSVGGNGNTTTLIPQPATIYSVSGTSSDGCVSQETITVAIGSTPLIVISSPPPVCALSPMTFSASGASTYTWTGGTTGPIVTYTPAGTSVYTVIGTNNSGCTGSVVVIAPTFSLPVISVSASNNTVCAGTSVTLNVLGAQNYTWSSGQTGSALVVTPQISTVYSCSGTSADGCISSGSATLTTRVLPDVNILQPSIICEHSPFTFTATGADTYIWHNGETTPVVTFTAGNATVFASINGTDANGCVSGKTITVKPMTLPVITAMVSHSLVCPGDTVALTALGAQTFTWSNSVSNGFPFILEASGVHTVSGTDANGCVGKTVISLSTYTVINPSVVSNTSSICSGESATLTVSSAGTFTWQSGETSNTMVVSPTVTTVYSVEAIDPNNCRAMGSIQILVDTCAANTLIDFIGIYPNPNNGRFFVKTGNREVVVEIYSITGALIQSYLVKGGEVPLFIDEKANGTYLIRVLHEGKEIAHKKLIKLD